MRYIVNVDYPTRRAKVHRADCESLNGPAKDPKNGYRKEFSTQYLALNDVEQFVDRGWTEVGPCGLPKCNP